MFLKDFGIISITVVQEIPPVKYFRNIYSTIDATEQFYKLLHRTVI